MFRIDTGQARTDLYKADPLDFSALQTNIIEDKKAKAVVKAAEDKAAKDHMDDIMDNIGKANRVAYMPKDAQLIADKTKAVTDYVQSNIEALKKGDIQATMGYQKLSGDLYSFAEQSKNFREKWEAEGTGISKDKDSYRPESVAAYMNLASTKTAGQHDFDPSIFKKNTNYLDRVEKVHRPYAIAISQRDDSGRKYTEDQARELVANDLRSDEKYYEQAAYDFNRATDEQKGKAKDPIEFYQNRYAPLLVFDDTKTKSAGGRGGYGKDEFKPVTAVVTQLPNGEATARVRVSGKENIKLKTLDPKDPSGKRTMDMIPMYVVKKPNGDIFLRGSVTKKNNRGEYRQEMEEVDYRDVADDMFTIFGIDNPVELLQGKGPSHVTFKNYDVSDAKAKPAAGNKAPAGKQLTKQLKSGKTVYSDDGGKTWHP
jgi:hypothetical protein